MQLNNEQKLTVIGLIAAVLIGSAVFFYNHFLSPAKPSILLDDPKKTAESKASGELIVHVCGAVGKEGVYKLCPGDRVIDAVKMAGGAQSNADLSSVNLAEEIKDGQRIVVAEKKIPAANKPQNFAAAGRGGGGEIVNLNTASESELDALPGVGPATAKKIIELRPFSKPEDLMKVPRFGKNKFEKIKDKVTV